MIVLQPNVSSCELPVKAQFIKYLSDGLALVVPQGQHTNTLLIVSTLGQMQIVKEIANQFQVNCATGYNDYYFIGLESNRVLIFSSHTHELLKTVMTRRPPISMTIVDKRLCVVGLRQHAFTAINFMNDFKSHGMTWNQGNDWIQLHTNSENNGFYRVW